MGDYKILSPTPNFIGSDYMFSVDFYEHLNGKRKKHTDNVFNYYYLLQVPLAMFDYDGLPDTIPQEWLEMFLLNNGTVGIGKMNDKLYAGMGSYVGEFNGYIPKNYTFAVPNVGSIEGVVGEDVVVGWNNSTLTPDFNLIKYSSIMTEIDTSEHINLLYSRLLRIPKVSDQKDKVAVEEAIKNILNGNITAVTSKNIQDLIGDNGDNRFLDLIDVNDIDKLQYLNQYYNNVQKRFYQEYGHPMQVTEKLSQQTNDEVHGGDSIALIHPISKLKYRQRMVDDINRVFGTNITVKFSELWEVNRDVVESEPDDDVDNDMTDDVDGGDDSEQTD